MRIRVFQQLYQSISSGRLDVALVDKSSMTSLCHIYYLYYYLLDLMRALAAYQREFLEIHERRFFKSSDKVTPRRLSGTTLAKEVARCTETQNSLDKMQRRWGQDEQLFRTLYNMVETSPSYSALPENAFMLSIQKQCDYWGSLLKRLSHTAELNERLAANSSYWADAAAICERLEVEEIPTVDQVEATVKRLKGSGDYRIIPFTNQPMVMIQDFVLKTLRRGAKDGLELPGDLLPMFHGDRGRLYAYRLLSETLLHREEYDATLTP